MPKLGEIIPMEGKQFGRLTVVGLGEKSKQGRPQWDCICSCGNKCTVESHRLRKLTRSCGCLTRESTVRRSTKHGMARRGSISTTYTAWAAMVERCTNPNTVGFKNYGGRGISIVPEWREFTNFLADMGERPFPRAQLDRIDNDKNYAPDNCRWITQQQNCCNRRNSIRITINGVTKVLKDWARASELNYSKLLAVYHKKGTAEVLTLLQSSTCK